MVDGDELMEKMSEKPFALSLSSPACTCPAHLCPLTRGREGTGDIWKRAAARLYEEGEERHHDVCKDYMIGLQLRAPRCRISPLLWLVAWPKQRIFRPVIRKSIVVVGVVVSPLVGTLFSKARLTSPTKRFLATRKFVAQNVFLW
ncbi:hypothetical protein BHM03_00012979 [Ensete ventricosum]|nr:hypothetical protein BHM03_00012979 [Ensete ventricosum]